MRGGGSPIFATVAGKDLHLGVGAHITGASIASWAAARRFLGSHRLVPILGVINLGPPRVTPRKGVMHDTTIRSHAAKATVIFGWISLVFCAPGGVTPLLGVTGECRLGTG